VPQRRTAPVELLWDLVFVFAITQVTALLAHHLSWGRLGEAMLALALVWWAWSAFVWAANAQPPDSRTLRACLLAATVLIFLVGLALPQAFGAEALLFLSAYALVRFLHLALYVDASRSGNAAWSAIAGFAVTIVIGMALLFAGAIAHGWGRVALWTLALAIDYSVTAPMPSGTRLALCGGVAVYLLGIAAFRLRLLGEASTGRCGVAVALLALFAIGGGRPAWAIGAGIAALVCALCVLESVLGQGPEGESAGRVPEANRGPA
jgi:hypothetical protein